MCGATVTNVSSNHPPVNVRPGAVHLENKECHKSQGCGLQASDLDQTGRRLDRHLAGLVLGETKVTVY
ncbi:hypothetical protein RRG08_045395 [Elysia crispata]|uniref:Uncharacterized protein n=1 Tax=Elysia crispata TaxID=231223 RepID=A0AAE1ANC2_9GAST|nr:hypothetical protein RRG08_045395 [Elysia crispata]